jgi:hypothetical protein
LEELDSTGAVMRNVPRLRRSFSAITLILASMLLLAGRRLSADLDDEIGAATDAGIEFLLKAIDVKQVEAGEHPEANNGKIALETYALVVAGVPVDNPTIKKNFETLSQIKLEHTYTIACYIFALDAAISQLQNDAALAAPSQVFKDDPAIGAAYRPRLEAGVNALVKIRQAGGGWNYTAEKGRFDNSNVQFAVLGLGVGGKRKVPIAREVWEQVVQHYFKCQKKDGPEVKERPEFHGEDEKGEGKRDRVNLIDKQTGKKVEKGEKPAKEEKEKERKGSPTVPRPAKPSPDFGPEALQYFSREWYYEVSSGGNVWNMTCGGTSSMILAAENLKGLVPPDMQNLINKSIRDGYGWIMTNWQPVQGDDWRYYGLYSLEKVADLGEVKRFAGHDWYQEAARFIIDDQRKDGSWPGKSPTQVRWNSAFALLILNRATSLLTQGRVVAGKRRATDIGGARKDKNSDERNWVYIPEYEREFHIPSILRQIRLRPSQKLVKMLELALKHYPEINNGFLVVNLVNLRDSTKIKGVKMLLKDQLVKITGVDYETSEQYLAWCNRWVDVDRIGQTAKDPQDMLKTYFAHTSRSIPLKKKILWAVGRCNKEKNVVEGMPPLLLADLNNADQDIRQEAYEKLSMLGLSREPIPVFDAKGAQATRDGQVVEIKTWYGNRKPRETAPPPAASPAASPTPAPAGAPGGPAPPAAPAPGGKP